MQEDTRFIPQVPYLADMHSRYYHVGYNLERLSEFLLLNLCNRFIIHKKSIAHISSGHHTLLVA